MVSGNDIPLVVLFGGGIESTTLVRRFLAQGRLVWPIYQHWGLRWEDCELSYVRRFWEANACERLLPLTVIRHAPHEALRTHWGMTGLGIPRAGDPGDALEIPERNVTLLTTAAAQLTDLPEMHLVMGTTADNHFSDGTREFFDDCAGRLRLQHRRPVYIWTPLIGSDKSQVIRQADRDSLALSFSCIDPRQELHCGVCYKCGRRQAAFRTAGVPDPTVYANLP